jgi:two-component system, response regulator, stage 0 sporulation protein A
MNQLGAVIINETNQLIENISNHFLMCPSLEKEVIKYKNNLHDLIETYHQIDHILKELCVPCNIKGYSYLKSAIQLLKTNNYLIKDVYKIIAKNNNTNIYCVERSIRHAIEVSFNRCNIKAINHFFPKTSKDRPTNNEYIKTIISLIN